MKNINRVAIFNSENGISKIFIAKGHSIGRKFFYATKQINYVGGIMTKTITNKFLLFIGIVVILLLSSCVDTDVENIPTSFTDLKSEVRFMNQVDGAQAVIAVEGAQVGTIPANDSSGYAEYQAGRKTVTATFSSGQSAEESLSFDTDYKITFTIVEDTTTGVRSFQKSQDGYIWE